MRFAILVAVAIAAALPAHAGPADFARCDGYPAPKGKSDGIATTSGVLGIGTATVDMRRGAGSRGTAAVAACDTALADPVLVDAHWLRRTHLLQARALHLIAAGEFAEALVALDRSDAVGRAHGSARFAESVAVGNLALRGLALHRLERGEEAEVALAAADAARPQSISLRQLTRTIRLGFDHGRAREMALLRADAPYDARLVETLFWNAVLGGDFAAAVDYAASVTFDLPRSRGGWTIEGADTRRYKRIEERAQFEGAAAYALFASSKPEAATARIAAARADLEALRMPPETGKKGKVREREAADYQLRLAYARRGGTTLDIWERSIAARKESAGKPLGVVEKAIEAQSEPGKSIVPDMITDIMRQATLRNSFEIARLQYRVDLEDKGLARDRDETFQIKEYELAKLLPRPEAEGMVPRLDGTGLLVRESGEGGRADVSFESDKASSALVEEAAFLAAADYASSKGADAFLIETSQLIQRTTQTYTYYGGGGGQIPSGYELRLVVVPVQSAAMPESTGWRLIRVDAVRARLAAKFAARKRR